MTDARSPKTPLSKASAPSRTFSATTVQSDAAKSFGFSKSTDEHMRRASFSEVRFIPAWRASSARAHTHGKLTPQKTLTDALQRRGAIEPGIKRGGGWLYKKTTTGAWAKRFYVIHGHYLTYFTKEISPQFDELPMPAGSLDMWHVDSVSLDSNILVLRLSPEAAEARRDEMGAQLIREGKKMVQSLTLPGATLAKTVMKQMETARRGTHAPTLVLRATSSHEAAAWLRAMRESPLMGSMGSAGANALPVAGGDDHRVIKEVRVLLPPGREINYGDTLLDTTILIRQLPARGASLSVVVNVKGADRTGSAPFEPAHGDLAGSLQVALSGCADVCQIDWERKVQTRSHFALLAAAAGVFVFIMTYLVLRSLRVSAALGLAASVADMAYLTVASREANDIVLTRAAVHVGSGALSATLATATPKPGKDKKAVGTSADLNVTAEEVGAIAELRRRLADFYAVSDDVDTFVKKHQRFLENWGADMGALKNTAKRKATIDKHLMHSDFRAVRFIRARKGNMDKAETMARESLTWRVALGSDEILQTHAMPRWMLEYTGSPVFTELSGVGDVEARFERFWVRDTEGHLAVFFRVGKAVTRKIYKKVHANPEFLIKCVIWATEMARLDLDRMHETTKGKVDSTLTAFVGAFALLPLCRCAC